jgi:uncharacterized protein YidB (DUF937 family)
VDILKTAGQLLQQQFGDGAQSADMTNALQQLLGGQGGSLDFSNMISKMNDSGLMSMAQSWLGDGENQGVSGAEVQSLLGADKIKQFASQLDIPQGDASKALSEILPQLIDESSSGGNLLDSGNIKGGLLAGLGKMLGNRPTA